MADQAVEMEAQQVEQQVEHEEQQLEEQRVLRFACKKCRCVLFSSEDLMAHEPERHQISARRKLKDMKYQGAASAHVDACSSFFLEEVLPWMDENLLAEGKIHCPTPKCHSRLGALQWSGSQCSCGTWVTPSIKITKSRVDQLHEASHVPIVTGVMLPPHAVVSAPVATAGGSS